MNVLKSAIGLCAKIHEMYATFAANQDLCSWLLSTVQSIMTVLKLQLTRDAVPMSLEGPLIVLLEDLRSCEAILRDFSICHRVTKFVFGSKYALQFKESGYRLISSHTIFCSAVSTQLAADQHDKLDRIQLVLDARLDLDSKHLVQDCRCSRCLALDAAFQQHMEHYNQDLARQFEDRSWAEALESLGFSQDSISRRVAFPVSDVRAITTFEGAESCCWYIRSDEISFDMKDVGRRKERQKVSLGKPGSFGDVYAAKHCRVDLDCEGKPAAANLNFDGMPVAVKKLRSPVSADDLASCPDAFAAFVKEVTLAFSLNHPNIVRTFGGVVDPKEEPPCWIVMERLERSLAEVNHRTFVGD
jgi:hypothetical protein